MGDSDEVPDVMDRGYVAYQLGVRPNTITYYQTESQPGGRYASRPFPAPDGRIGHNSPYWLGARWQEILDWFESRPRPRVGGRKRRS